VISSGSTVGRDSNPWPLNSTSPFSPLDYQDTQWRDIKKLQFFSRVLLVEVLRSSWSSRSPPKSASLSSLSSPSLLSSWLDESPESSSSSEKYGRLPTPANHQSQVDSQQHLHSVPHVSKYRFKFHVTASLNKFEKSFWRMCVNDRWMLQNYHMWAKSDTSQHINLFKVFNDYDLMKKPRRVWKLWHGFRLVYLMSIPNTYVPRPCKLLSKWR